MKFRIEKRGCELYRNLMAELSKRAVSLDELSEKMGMDCQVMSSKIANRNELKFKEAVKIKAILKTDMPLEQLFYGNKFDI